MACDQQKVQKAANDIAKEMSGELELGIPVFQHMKVEDLRLIESYLQRAYCLGHNHGSVDIP